MPRCPGSRTGQAARGTRFGTSQPDPTDGRFTNAILTEKGFKVLAEAAPGHVAHVRSLVIDVLSPEQLRRLGRDAARITAWTTPPASPSYFRSGPIRLPA